MGTNKNKKKNNKNKADESNIINHHHHHLMVENLIYRCDNKGSQILYGVVKHLEIIVWPLLDTYALTYSPNIHMYLVMCVRVCVHKDSTHSQAIPWRSHKYAWWIKREDILYNQSRRAGSIQLLLVVPRQILHAASLQNFKLVVYLLAYSCNLTCTYSCGIYQYIHYRFCTVQVYLLQAIKDKLTQLEL